jgi:hypothetical protein
MPTKDSRSNELKSFLADYAAQFSKLMKARPGTKYQSQEALVAAEGMAYSNEPLTPEEKRELKKLLAAHLKYNRPKVKECYMNAYRLAKTAERMGIPLLYAEGFGHNLIHTGHAWGSYHGKPIDLTWRELDDRAYSVKAVLERIEKNIQGNGYVGFTVPISYLEALQLKHRIYCSAMDNWKDGWPLVRKGLAALEKGTR